MSERVRVLTIFFFAFLLTGLSEPAEIQESANTSDWYFVDEIIIDQPPDYRSDLFFADKANITQGDQHFNIPISHIVMMEVAGTHSLKDQITDMRSQMIIDCRERIYRKTEMQLFDGEAQPIEVIAPEDETPKWKQPESNAGYAGIIKLVCEADNNLVEQKFPGHIQPLNALLAYLNADWSK